MRKASLPNALGQVQLIAVTFISKAIGLTREILLLGAVGLSRDLDNFFFFFGVSSLMMILMSSTIYTNVTPFFARAVRRGAAPGEVATQLVSDSVLIGAAAALFCGALNAALFLWITAAEPDTPPIMLAVALAPCIALFFNVIAEYLSSILTASQRIAPLVFGNIAISVPPIAFLLIVDTTIPTYTAIFALAYGLRALLLFVATMRVAPLRIRLHARLQAREAILAPRAESLIAGSAVTAVQMAFMLALFLSRALPEGSAALYSYSIKFPHLYTSTVWFVLGAAFFASIVNHEAEVRPLRRIAALAALNAAIVAALMLAIFVALQWMEAHPRNAAIERYALIEIAKLALQTAPAALFISIIDMSQKTLATAGGKRAVLRISATLLGVFAVTAPIALFTDRLEPLLLALNVSFAAAATVALASVAALGGKKGRKA